jgi:hypothetical protein
MRDAFALRLFVVAGAVLGGSKSTQSLTQKLIRRQIYFADGPHSRRRRAQTLCRERELITILKKNWDDFAKFFSAGRDQVITWLEHINKCRADAHAKTLNEDDLAFLRVCFRRLEETLSLK